MSNTIHNNLYNIHDSNSTHSELKCFICLSIMLKIIMTHKEAKKALERINKLPKDEKKFAKGLFLHKYLVLIAHKGKVNFSIRR